MQPGFQRNNQRHNVSIPMHFEDWEPVNSFGSDPVRRVIVGESPYQMAGMQTEHRIKRQNRGNNMALHHDLIFGSRDQIGSRLSVASGGTRGILNYPHRIMSSGFHNWAGEGNRAIIDRSFQAVEAGSSGPVRFQSYNGSLLRNSGPEREPFNHWRYNPSANYTDSCYTHSDSRSKRKRSMYDSVESIESFAFRRTAQQGRDLPWFHEEGTSSGAASVNSLLFSTRRVPVLDQSYPRNSIVPSQLSRTSPVQHVRGGSNQYHEEHSNILQLPLIRNIRGSPDAMMSYPPWISRGAPINECMMPSAQSSLEIAPVQQENLSSSLVPRRGNGIFSGESSMANSHLHRGLNAGAIVEAQARSFPNEASSGMGFPSWMRNTFDISRRGFQGFSQRESTLPRSYQASVAVQRLVGIPSPPAPLISHNGWNAQGGLASYHLANGGGMNVGSLAASVSAFPPFGSLDRSLIPSVREPTEIAGPSPPLHYYVMPFQGSEMLVPQRGSYQQLPSHESLDYASTYNEFENQDHHLNLQPDVDSMSYEELLALEERIGNVNTGLSEESINKCLQTSKHPSFNVTISISEDSDVKCSICQEEYVEGDELGQLNCSHSYHTDCIKQWLILKNQCPICKAAALASP